MVKGVCCHNYVYGVLILFREFRIRSRTAFHSSTRGVPDIWEANSETIKKADTTTRILINKTTFLEIFNFLLAWLSFIFFHINCYSIFEYRSYFQNPNITF